MNCESELVSHVSIGRWNEKKENCFDFLVKYNAMNQRLPKGVRFRVSKINDAFGNPPSSHS